MGATVEALPGRTLGLRSSAIRRPLTMRMRDYRILLDPDGSLRSFDSLPERRAVFGFERLSIHEVQAGVVVEVQGPDLALRGTPQQAQVAGSVCHDVEVAQFVE